MFMFVLSESTTKPHLIIKSLCLPSSGIQIKIMELEALHITTSTYIWAILWSSVLHCRNIGKTCPISHRHLVLGSSEEEFFPSLSSYIALRQYSTVDFPWTLKWRKKCVYIYLCNSSMIHWAQAKDLQGSVMHARASPFCSLHGGILYLICKECDTMLFHIALHWKWSPWKGQQNAKHTHTQNQHYHYP